MSGRRFLHGLIGIAAAALLIGGTAAYFAISKRPSPPPDAFGVTFSTQYAASLGLDWREAFTAMLDDLHVRHFRIPVYWDDVEAQKGTYHWDDVDWMLSEASKRGADVILVVGRKVPRWPECHIPGWASTLDAKSQNAQVLTLVRQEVDHFKDAPAIRRWQVENEPLFQFGVCPPPDRAFLKTEVALVRSLDARPIMLTDSGELSVWIPAAQLADTFGISLYRTVWNRWLGFWNWPFSPSWYAERIDFIRPFVRGRQVIISELQAEPWFSKPIAETTLDEQYQSMNISRFRDNVDFAIMTGAKEIDLWGAEWWYWLKVQGHPEFWNEAKKIFS